MIAHPSLAEPEVTARPARTFLTSWRLTHTFDARAARALSTRAGRDSPLTPWSPAARRPGTNHRPIRADPTRADPTRS